MANKIPSNYKPKYSRKEIYEFISVFTRNLKASLEENLNVFEVEAPLYSTEKVTSEIYEMLISRLITFGTVTDDHVYHMYNNFNYWFRNELKNLEVETGNGIYALLNYVKRDSFDNNHETLRKKELHIEIRYDGETPETKMQELLELVNKSISSALVKSYKDLLIKEKNKFAFTYHDFAKEGLDIHDVVNQVDSVTEKEGASAFTNVNAKGKRSIASADEPTYALTTLWFKVTKDAHSIVKAGFRKPYAEMKELVSSEKLDSKDELHFAIKQLDKKVPNSIYFDIDVLRIIQNALDLAHIGEVITDTQNESVEKLKKLARKK